MISEPWSVVPSSGLSDRSRSLPRHFQFLEACLSVHLNDVPILSVRNMPCAGRRNPSSSWRKRRVQPFLYHSVHFCKGGGRTVRASLWHNSEVAEESELTIQNAATEELERDGDHSSALDTSALNPLWLPCLGRQMDSCHVPGRILRKALWEQALFHGIPTHGRKDIEFQSFYELKKLENCFYSYFDCRATTHGTLSYVYATLWWWLFW